MKKLFYFLLCAILITLSSCSKEEATVDAPVIESITVNGQTIGETFEAMTGDSPIVFEVTASNVPISKYEWKLDDEVVTDATEATFSLPASNSGTFKVTVTVTNVENESTSSTFTVNLSGPYKEGMLFNGTSYEDWAFLNVSTGEFFGDNLFKTVNGTTVGSEQSFTGGINDFYIYNNKLYLLNPTDASGENAQIVVCDAQTMKKQKSITAENFKTQNLGEIYNLMVINENKFYIGHNVSSGTGVANAAGVCVLTVDENGNTSLSSDLDGTAGELGVDGPCWSRMLKVGKYVLVGCGSKLQVIDSDNDQVVKTIEKDPMRQVTDIVKGRDGNVYAIFAGKADKSQYGWAWGPVYTSAASVVAINPSDFSEISENEILVDGNMINVKGGLNSSCAVASLTSDEIFFAQDGWGAPTIYSYNYKTGNTSLFVTVDGYNGISGYMGTDKAGQLYISTTNYSYSTVELYNISDKSKVAGKSYTVTGDAGVSSTYRFQE